MISYTLEYTDEADNMLANAWITATDRKAVNSAQNQIDRYLSSDPKNTGKEIAEGLWKIQVLPLIAYYEVNETIRLVTLTGFGLES